MATKASEKAAACKKLTTLLQKEYGKSVPKLKQPVLETIMFAICLEDNDWEAAEISLEKMLKSFFDLNEVRVSSVTEIERELAPLRDADWKGLRLISILRYVYQSTYTFDFEKLAKLTVESAQKRLKKVDYISPFVTAFTLQQVLGSHVVPLDNLAHRALIHLGMVPADSSLEDASEFIKGGLKKSEAFGFCCLLRKFATDPQFTDRLLDEYDQVGEFDVTRVADRMAVLKAPKKKKVAPKKKAAAKKKIPKKKAGKKKTPAKLTASKAAAKKKSPAKKKTPAKKKVAAKKKAESKKKAPAKKKAARKKK